MSEKQLFLPDFVCHVDGKWGMDKDIQTGWGQTTKIFCDLGSEQTNSPVHHSGPE